MTSHSHAESAEVPTEMVENVVVALDDAVEYCRSHPGDHSHDYNSLHDRVCHTEVKGIFERYENHEVLTLEDIKESIATALTQLETELAQDPDDETMRSGYQLLKNRGKEIDRATRRYVQTVSKFFHIKKQQHRLEREDFISKFEEIDQMRRTAHNGLIETLTIYTKTIHQLQQYGALGGLEVKQWRTEQAFSDEEGSENVVYVFAPEILQNRDLVKDWAVSAHMYNRLGEISEMQKRDAQP